MRAIIMAVNKNIRRGTKMKLQKITQEEFETPVEPKNLPAIKVYKLDSNPKSLMDQFPMIADWYMRVPNMWVEDVVKLLQDRKYIYKTIQKTNTMIFAVIYQRG